MSDLFSGGWIKAIFAFCLTCLSSFFGLTHPPTYALMTLLVFDYGLGAARAWKTNKFNNFKFLRGAGKFLIYALAINIAWKADEAMGIALYGFSFRNILCAYLAANEALSALTHLGAFGFPVPLWLMERLRKYRSEIEKSGEGKK